MIILELKNTINEMKNSTDSINNRMDQAEKESVNQKTGSLKFPTQEKKKKNEEEQRNHDLWDIIKRNNLQIFY